MTVFDRQLAAIADADLDALMAQYHEEAVLVRFDRVATGLAEIREVFRAYLALGPKVEEVKSLQTTGDVVFYNALMTVNGNKVDTFGTFVIRDGRIWRQTAAAVPA